MSIFVAAFLTIAAFLTSIMSAVIGMAGGVTLLGFMTAVLPSQQVVPLHGAVQLFSNFTRTAVFLRYVRWPIFAIYALPYAIGIVVSTLVWKRVTFTGFEAAIGAFLILFLGYRRWSPKVRDLPLWAYVPVGLITGFLALFVGAIGPLTAAFFFRDDFSKEEVIATSAICQAWGHLAKIPAFFILGFDFFSHAPVLIAMFTAVTIGSILGKRVLERMSLQLFIRLFEAVLFMMGIYLFVHGLQRL